MLDGILPPNIFVEIPRPKQRRPFRLREAMHPLQIEHFRRASAGEKLEQIAAMRDMAVELQMIGLRSRHPDWTEEKLRHEARRHIMYART